MSNKKVETQNTSLAVANSFPLFKGVDFAGLNKTIESLAENNKELSNEEKTLAVQVINDWTNSVTDKLRVHQSEMNSLLNFFDGNGYGNNYYNGRHHGVIDDAKQEELAGVTNTLDLYNKYRDADELVNDLRRNTPEYPVENVDETKAEYVIRMRDYEKANALHSLEISRADRTKSLAFNAWKKAIIANPDIKDILKKARSYVKNVDNLYTDCKNKGNLAKLNVTISSANVRTALRELLDFSVEL
jgi:hypothetical protein